jgi:hypothetical protein
MCLPFLIPWWTQSGPRSGRSRANDTGKRTILDLALRKEKQPHRTLFRENLYVRTGLGAGQPILERPNLNRTRGNCIKMQDIRHLTQRLPGR